MLLLNSLGIPSPSKWCHSSVRRIIVNEKYVGDLKTEKYYTENVLTHKKKINYGKKQYFTANHHEQLSIVSYGINTSKYLVLEVKLLGLTAIETSIHLVAKSFVGYVEKIYQMFL